MNTSKACGKDCGDSVPCELAAGHGSAARDSEMAHGYLRGESFIYFNLQNERVTFDANDEDARERRILDAAKAYLVYDNETPETPTLKTETEIDRAIAAWRAKQDGQSRSFRLWKITDGNAEVLSEGRESSDAPKEK